MSNFKKINTSALKILLLICLSVSIFQAIDNGMIVINAQEETQDVIIENEETPMILRTWSLFNVLTIFVIIISTIHYCFYDKKEFSGLIYRHSKVMKLSQGMILAAAILLGVGTQNYTNKMVAFDEVSIIYFSLLLLNIFFTILFRHEEEVLD